MRSGLARVLPLIAASLLVAGCGDSPKVSEYRANFTAQVPKLDASIDALLSCSQVTSCNRAANEVDVLDTGLGDFIPPYNARIPAVPVCLTQVQQQVTAAYVPLRYASHSTFGLSAAPPGAVTDARAAQQDLRHASALLAAAHC